MLGLRRLWNRRGEDFILPQPAIPEPEPELSPPYRDQYQGDDGLTEVQRAMRDFGLCELEHRWPSQIAAEFIAYQREWGFCDYPYLVDDLNDELTAFCKTRNYLMPHLQVLREAVAAQPGVGSPRRERLSRHNPKHRFILQRQMARGSTNDRPTLYYISATVPTLTLDQSTPWYAHGDQGAEGVAPARDPEKSRPGRPRKKQRVDAPLPDHEQPLPQRRAA